MKEARMVKNHYGMNYLKLLLTLFVVLHHTILAYLPGGPGVTVDDPDNFMGFMYLATYFDQFFMFAFFFISGLFTYQSLRRRGPRNYLLHKTVKFGTVFLIGTYLFNPTAFYFMEIAKGVEWWVPYASFSTYISYMHDVGRYLHPAQHLWFLWVLLAFNMIIVGFDRLFPAALNKRVQIKSVPFTMLGIFMIMSSWYILVGSSLGYGFIPIRGPFFIQMSRAVPYFTLFLGGVIIGKPMVADQDRQADTSHLQAGLLLRLSSSPLRSAVWLVCGIVLSLLTVIIPADSQGVYAWMGPIAAAIAGSIGYVSLFHFIEKEHRIMSFLAAHAFGMYIFHYGFVAILHGMCYHLRLSGLFKAVLVFSGALILSLALTVSLRKTRWGRYVL